MMLQPQDCAARSSDVQALARLVEIAAGLGEPALSADLQQLVTRVEEGRFFVACVGQFKRGKSTLLDAFVGEQILPTGVVPVTAVPTVLRYGNPRTARVLVDSGWRVIDPEDLAQYVSEELNPENSRQDAGVEVFLPSPLLAGGMCLVDTPGIGSVFSGNTETTKQFIPQIDAAILVIGADPPISGEELALIQAVAANVDEVLIVLNKVDRVSSADRQHASDFAAKILDGCLQKPVGQIYEVSALNRLNNAADADDWNLLLEALQLLAVNAGKAMTRSAAERGIRRFSASLQRSINERRRALTEPIANSRQRIVALQQTVSQAEQSLRDLGALFSAEQMRLSLTLQLRRKEFLKRVVPAAIQEFVRASNVVATAFGPGRRREFMAIAQTVARASGYAVAGCGRGTRGKTLCRSYPALCNFGKRSFCRKFLRRRPPIFLICQNRWTPEHGFRTRSRFFFHDMITLAQPASPLLYLSDCVTGVLHIRSWVRQDAVNFLEHLLDTNAARVQGDVEQRVVESRLRLESDVRKLLREVSISAEQALSKASELMAAGAGAVQHELECLRKLQEELDDLAAVR